MRVRRLLAATLAFALMGCDPLDRTELTLNFDDKGEKVAVQIVADTGRLRVLRKTAGDRLGDDILAARDEWSLRLSNAEASEEQIVLHRVGRELTRVEHRARIDTQNLDRLFFDVGASMQFTGGDGWVELTVYPGSSTRATRQQRESVDKRLKTYATYAARYFESLKRLYAYMDENPQRAEDIFVALYDEGEQQPVLSDDERDLLAPVRESADLLLGSTGEEEQRELARDADMVFNPFPAHISVVIPSEPLVVEGFTRGEGRSLVASTATPFEAIAGLEGRWIAPDPLAVLVRAEPGASARQLGAQAATQKRVAAPLVTASEIERAVKAAIQPAPRYRVRWTVTGSSPR